MKRNPLKHILGFLVAGILFLSVSFPVRAQMQKNSLCPVMPGTRVNEKFYVDYHGERIYFCCRSCVKAFKKHPEKYLKELQKIYEQQST